MNNFLLIRELSYKTLADTREEGVDPSLTDVGLFT